MRLNELSPQPGSTHKKRRAGRGVGSGKGKTAGRGQKGQKSRSGVAIGTFEGGQTNIAKRLPKRGFKPYGGKEEYCTLNVCDLERLAASGRLEPFSIVDANRLKNINYSRASQRLKLLGEGKIETAFHVICARASKAAAKKILEAGGSIIIGQADNHNELNESQQELPLEGDYKVSSSLEYTDEGLFHVKISVFLKALLFPPKILTKTILRVRGTGNSVPSSYISALKEIDGKEIDKVTYYKLELDVHGSNNSDSQSSLSLILEYDGHPLKRFEQVIPGYGVIKKLTK